jgi:nucleoside-diphosphate-sugar epimerase
MPGERGRALVVGGTGPTGPFVVGGLCQRGYSVTMVHTGRHERSEIPADVTHVHTDPFDRRLLADALGDDTFDVGIVMYGRLRDVAEVLVGRVERLVTVGGMPVLDGYGNPGERSPTGMLVPTSESAPTIDPGSGPGNEKAMRMVETEQAVFAAHPSATHLRYPVVYGPHQLLPREWMVVRRILDGRRRMILPDGGLYLCSAVYAENAAHAVLLSVDQPEHAAGEIYHVGDETTPTLRQVVEIVASALDHRFELVDMPYELALPAHPLMMRAGAFHRYTPPTKLVEQLGYRDRVSSYEALAHTARWLRAHPLEQGGTIERSLQDPYDYAAEDALMDAWLDARERLLDVSAAADPYFVDRYSPMREAARERRRAARAAHTL